MSNSWVEYHNDPETANLGVSEFFNLPFDVKRIYWITDFKQGAIRGLHAHKKLCQIFIVVSGSITIQLFECDNKREDIEMSKNSQPLLIEPGIWRVLTDASPDALLLVMASEKYDESDYIRNWDEYLEWCGN